MKTTEISKKTKIQERREELKELSQPLKALVKVGALASINEGLKSIYEVQGHTELNTLKGWNKKGFRVKKGAKALILWAEPKNISKKDKEQNNRKEDNKEESQEDKGNFFPICFVFSNLQVEKGGAK